MSEGDDWVEIKRFGDAIGADMICDFLREHDVRVQIRGNTQATRMTWSQTTENIRIVVQREDLEKAHEALAAMNAGEAQGHPFRDLSAPKEADDEAEEKFVKPRSVVAAAVLGVILPIGAGHFYARHGAAGTILFAGIAGTWIAAFAGGHFGLARAWGILVAVDVVGSFFAVRRHNAGKTTPEGTQRISAMLAVLGAFMLSWLMA